MTRLETMPCELCGGSGRSIKLTHFGLMRDGSIEPGGTWRPCAECSGAGHVTLQLTDFGMHRIEVTAREYDATFRVWQAAGWSEDRPAVAVPAALPEAQPTSSLLFGPDFDEDHSKAPPCMEGNVKWDGGCSYELTDGYEVHPHCLIVVGFVLAKAWRSCMAAITKADPELAYLVAWEPPWPAVPVKP